jgi:hypothetical protein
MEGKERTEGNFHAARRSWMAVAVFEKGLHAVAKRDKLSEREARAMACAVQLDLTKPIKIIIEVEHQPGANPIHVDKGGWNTAHLIHVNPREMGLMMGRPLTALAEMGMPAPGSSMEELERALLLEGLLKLAADAKFAPTALAAPEQAPAKTRKPPREFRHLDPPLSPTGNRLFVAAHLEYTLEFQWCERIIRERARHWPGVDLLDRPEETHKGNYDSVHIPEPVAYWAWQQRLEEQRLKEQQIEQQRQLKLRRK